MSNDDISTDFGVQDDGTFRRKHVDRIREDAVRRVKDTAGENIEFRQGSGQQAMIDMHAQTAAVLWMAVEDVYYATFFEDARGEALDKQLALAGFTRRPAQSATGEVTFRRDSPASEDIDIDAGTIVTTRRTDVRPAIPFETTEDVILQEGETEVTAPIEARKPWQSDLGEQWLGEETNVQAGQITEFGEPVSGVDEVENELPTGDETEGFQPGRDRETDPELRLRYQNSFADAGAATVPAIRAEIFNASDEIQSVGVEEIRDSQAGDYGVRVTVLAPGVDDDTIAQAIADSRAGGVDSFGEESGTAVVNGDQQTEYFDVADRVDIYVDVDLTTTDTFPDDGEEQITDRLIRSNGGEGTDGILYPGELAIGDDVIYDQIFRRVLETRGVIEADVEIGTTDPPGSTSNISIDDDEAAITSPDEVSIDVS